MIKRLMFQGGMIMIVERATGATTATGATRTTRGHLYTPQLTNGLMSFIFSALLSHPIYKPILPLFGKEAHSARPMPSGVPVAHVAHYIIFNWGGVNG